MLYNTNPLSKRLKLTQNELDQLNKARDDAIMLIASNSEAVKDGDVIISRKRKLDLDYEEHHHNYHNHHNPVSYTHLTLPTILRV